MAKQANTPKAAPVAKAKAAAPKAKAAPAPVVPTPAPVVAAPVVAVTRLQVQAVALANKPYKVAAGHNAAWWAQVTAAIGQGNGRAAVQALTAAGVPPAFVGYSVRRGWLVAA